MAVFPAFCVLFLIFNGIAGYTLRDDYWLEWPSEYHFTGEEIDFMTKLIKPFEMWYSSSINRSRIDYYGGTVKKYYYGDYGLILNVHSVTDEDLNPSITCDENDSTEPQKDFLPDPYDLVYAGTESLNDKEVDVWKFEEQHLHEWRSELTVHVYRNQNDEVIPVRKVFKQYNLHDGAPMYHVISNYYNFKETFSEIELEYQNFDDCVPSLHDSHSNKLMDDDSDHLYVPLEIDKAFDSYTKHHKKNYKENEHEMRKNIFEQNLRTVEEVNRQNLGYKLALNKFSDHTDEELRHLTGTIPSDLRNLNAAPFPHSLEEIDKLAEDLPESFDLRMEGVITPIKDQANCGSCWSFATTATVESAIARTNGGKLIDLSEQSLVDCAWGYYTFGCNGGILDGAMTYVSKYGIPTEEQYGKYMDEDSTCRVRNMSSTYKIRGFSMVTPRHSNALKLALYKYGPVAVGIHASTIMSQYSSGVFYDFKCKEGAVNHAVTVVGYGVRDGEEYWIVKNSWGEAWGEDGYILLAAKNNNCWLLDTPYYPIV